ncbi:hypothetical protein CD117_01600 [Mammaliicoccus sciuri]|uniref:Uncharacterized protein n=1 Tax=Mammaliicoccus sciuri TaxID=1296 RepID=A0AAJ4SJZ4_MAMSC|nr:hypothetical protein [Mammaliicoccus sciuri]RTX75016.1 hypothetical protein CD117_01600 [Mammaliicoccus sciuri]
MIEEKMAKHLNESGNFTEFGRWIRQDPGFPDNIFSTDFLENIPGLEIKAWMPFSTEITGRFKTSRKVVLENPTYVAIVAWMPEFILHGRPEIIDIWVEPALNIVENRDRHYNKPPNYILVEPSDTSSRTKNLQQSNVEGYSFQNSNDLLEKAYEFTENSGLLNIDYPLSEDEWKLLEELKNKFPYRLDTNFGKLNRINNVGINDFKDKVYAQKKFNKTIGYWKKISNDKTVLHEYLKLFPMK